MSFLCSVFSLPFFEIQLHQVLWATLSQTGNSEQLGVLKALQKEDSAQMAGLEKTSGAF